MPLERRDSSPNPVFLSSDWINAFERQILKKDETLQLIDTERGTLPFYKKRNGKTLFSLSNYYTPYFGLFNSCTPKLNEIAWQGLVKNVQFTRASIYPITATAISKLEKEILGKPFTVEPYYYSQNWRHPDIESFDSFKKSCSQNLIKTTERYARRMARDPRFKLVLYQNKLSDKIFNDYCQVYRQSWKVPEPALDFLKEVYQAAAKQGQLRIGLIYYDQTPISVQVWFVHNKTAFIYKLAYDEEYAKTRAGNILFLEMARAAIEQEQVECLDFLTGEDQYKSKWMTECRKLHGVVVYNKTTLQGRYGALVFKIKKKIKTLLPGAKRS